MPFYCAVLYRDIPRGSSKYFTALYYFLQKQTLDYQYLGPFLQVSFLNIKFETKCMLLMSAVRLFGIRSMPVVDVIIQVTWHPV